MYLFTRKYICSLQIIFPFHVLIHFFQFLYWKLISGAFNFGKMFFFHVRVF